MTRNEILAMPAGRDIDALVEKYVFGREPELWKHYGMVSIQSYEYGGPPEYSTNISSAWDVIEKLATHDRDIFVSNEDGRYLCDIIDYQYGLDGPEPKAKYSSEYVEDAPLAICRAALLAVMEFKTK